MLHPYNVEKRPYLGASKQWNGQNADEIVSLISGSAGINDISVFNESYLVIRHTGGMRTLEIGDWALRGEDGAARFFTNDAYHNKYKDITA